MINALLDAWDSLLEWLLTPEKGTEDVLGSYWPTGLTCVPLAVSEVEDDSVDLEHDIAWPADALSVN